MACLSVVIGLWRNRADYREPGGSRAGLPDRPVALAPWPARPGGRGAPRGAARRRAGRAARRPTHGAAGRPRLRPRDRSGTGLLNPHGLRDHASRLADAVGAVLDHGAFPIVLGGDCTILLGITLALRRRGRSGLLFLDGHADFYQPEAEPTGEAASMGLPWSPDAVRSWSRTWRAGARCCATRTWWCSGSATPSTPPPRKPATAAHHPGDGSAVGTRARRRAGGARGSRAPPAGRRAGRILGPPRRRRAGRRGHARGRLPPPRRPELG